MGVFEIIIALFVLTIMIGFAYVALSIFYDIISYDFTFKPVATVIKIAIAIVVVTAIVQKI